VERLLRICNVWRGHCAALEVGYIRDCCGADGGKELRGSLKSQFLADTSRTGSDSLSS
jgi:hypothetical protein